MGKDRGVSKNKHKTHTVIHLVQWHKLHNVVGHRSPYPIVEYSVLGHAVGSTELLHPASIVAMQHLLADARAVGTGTPGLVLVTRCHVMFEE